VQQAIWMTSNATRPKWVLRKIDTMNFTSNRIHDATVFDFAPEGLHRRPAAGLRGEGKSSLNFFETFNQE
jgi:hypothetical protein